MAFCPEFHLEHAHREQRGLYSRSVRPHETAAPRLLDKQLPFNFSNADNKRCIVFKYYCFTV